MKNAVLVAVLWFVVLGGVPIWASTMGHPLSVWFAGYALIDLISAIFVGTAIKLAQT